MIYGHSFSPSVLVAIAALAVAPALLIAQTTRDRAMPERVQFASADRKTTLVGYVFKPSVQPGGRVPGVVMMHGRAGP
jgi:poly(3-hydroxybutyrate) depolymerase